MQLIFSSNNQHKIFEVQQLLKDSFQIGSLADIDCYEEIPETSSTISGNASQKSFYVFNKFGVNCFSDDTGLEISYLNGQPGVFSARYAGDHKSDADNIQKVLSEMRGVENRKANFKTVISLIIDGIETTFEGRIDGEILYTQQGEKGFGYDSIFQPSGYTMSFAEMNPEEKNKISHRAIAIRKLVDFLLTKGL